MVGQNTTVICYILQNIYIMETIEVSTISVIKTLVDLYND